MTFSCFLVLTSFIGVSLSLFDFLADGLHLKKQGFSRVLSCLLTLIPPLILPCFYPKGFITALSYAGILVAYLLIFLPALLVFKTRTNPKLVALYQAPGGRWWMVLIMLLAISVIVFQLPVFQL